MSAVPATLPDGEPAPPDGRLPAAVLAGAGRVPFGAYVHVPFCAARCGYCDFNTYTSTELGPGASLGSYADTVLAEIRLAAEVLGAAPQPLNTVFFGGGTPTLLPADHLGLIVRELRETFGLAPDAEITAEANPETVTPGYLDRLLAAGFTRISIGMQSAMPAVLAVLERQHQPGRPEAAVAQARAAGFAHVNLDLIYGTPGESDEDWRASLEAAIAAEPDHISAYALTIEPGTAMGRKRAAGLIEPVDDDVLADRYVLADQTLAAAGFQWYEVSNWARTAQARCRHNELYWSGANWWGFGPGAHSHIAAASAAAPVTGEAPATRTTRPGGGARGVAGKAEEERDTGVSATRTTQPGAPRAVRWWNVKHPGRYAALLQAGRSPAAGREYLDQQARFTERVMLAVRMREGLPVAELPVNTEPSVRQLLSWGLLVPERLRAGQIVLTQRGRLLADAVIRELLG